MYCQVCGTKLPDNAKFCPECGRKLSILGAHVTNGSKRIFTIKTALADYFKGALGETKLRELIKGGAILHTRVGSRIIIREEALDAWMAEQEKLSVKRERSVCQTTEGEYCSKDREVPEECK